MKDISTENVVHDDVELPVKFNVIDNGLFFRQALCSTKLPDGTDVHIDANASGEILVTLKPKGSENWRTYVISPHNLVSTIVKSEKK